MFPVQYLERTGSVLYYFNIEQDNKLLIGYCVQTGVFVMSNY